MENKKSKYISFGANFEPYVAINKASSEEKEIKGKPFISWGDDNKFPLYLNGLYTDVTSLRTIINSVCDYVCGDEVKTTNEYIINKEDIENLVYDIALSYSIYGGFALQVLRNRLGKVCKLVLLDMRFIRSDKKGEFIYYSEDFGKKYRGHIKALCYPAYDETQKQDVSIFLYKNEKFNVYPTPVHVAAITACEMERRVNDYHLNSLCNGFVGSVLVNMNNGVPEELAQEEIVNAFEEKFTGSENAGRVVVSFNDSKENAAEIIKLETEDFAEKYKALIERARNEIFASWRCTPNLCGITTESLGFNSEEYSQAFKLFNRTVIKPIQKLIIMVINKLYEGQLSVEITPFSINFDDEKTDSDKNIEVNNNGK